MTTSPRDFGIEASHFAARGTGARWTWLLALLIVSLGGCTHLVRQTTGLPKKHKFQNEQLLVRSDIRLPKTHPLIKDLEDLRKEISRTLKLPLQEQPVTVYLFADERRYAEYLQTAYPNLPPRRAYFVGTSEELAVYTFWGEKIQEDLRHEYTHGVLHACLKDVPLWLDEGLAEYFEVTTQPRGMNREYASKMGEALANGWRPDINRLEKIENVSQMQKGDYLESWAWTHFLLNDGEDSLGVLVDYVAELRETAKPGPLSARLRSTLPNADERFEVYAASLSQTVMAAGNQAPRK